MNDGTVYRQIEAERVLIENVLKCDNIHLFSFNCLPEIIADLNNYKDLTHYGSWINSLILRYMHDDKYRLTRENYNDYLDKELAYITKFDFKKLSNQVDYEDDYYAEALLCEEIYGIEPLELSADMLLNAEIKNAKLEQNADGGISLVCKGRLKRKPGNVKKLQEYLISNDFIGCKIELDDISDYNRLVFYGQKNKKHGQPCVVIYNDKLEVLASYIASYREFDKRKYQYSIDISEIQGKVTLIINGGYIDYTGSKDSTYTFSDITLY